MKLIDKSALVAEIERLISNGELKCQQSQENNDQESYITWSEHIATCGKILSFLNTIEVKEEPKLTVDDIMRLDALLISMWLNKLENNSYEEVLRQFKAQKGE